MIKKLLYILLLMYFFSLIVCTILYLKLPMTINLEKSEYSIIQVQNNSEVVALYNDNILFKEGGSVYIIGLSKNVLFYVVFKVFLAQFLVVSIILVILWFHKKQSKVSTKEKKLSVKDQLG